MGITIVIVVLTAVPMDDIIVLAVDNHNHILILRDLRSIINKRSGVETKRKTNVLPTRSSSSLQKLR